MSTYKFVVCVTGSISAYKSCDLVSQLKKAGHQVRVVMSQKAKEFIGPASLQSLSGHPVYIDDFAQETMMSHIELGRWCDATIIYPATAQTINSFASGTGQDLHQSLFLAYDFSKPFIIAPAMNTRMLTNPITQKSLKALAKMGCHILPTDSGDLACGESGEGRLLQPIDAMDKLLSFLKIKSTNKKRILITAGGTRETIDEVRSLTNKSTGNTGAVLADHLHGMGFQVLLLTSRYAEKPKSDVKVDTYETFTEIYNTLKALGKTKSFDMILHAAAISDYSINKINTPDGNINPGTGKMSSEHDNISIELKRNEKILPRLKDLFPSEPTVVGFKLTSTESKEEQAKAIFSLFTENSVDYVVHNDMKDINLGNRKYLMTSKEGQQENIESTENLASHISKILNRTFTPEVTHDLVP